MAGSVSKSIIHRSTPSKKMKTFILLAAFVAIASAAGGDGSGGGMNAHLSNAEKQAMKGAKSRLPRVLDSMMLCHMKKKMMSGKGGLCPMIKAKVCVGCPEMNMKIKNAMETCGIPMPQMGEMEMGGEMNSEVENMGEMMRMDDEKECLFKKQSCMLKAMKWVCPEKKMINYDQIKSDLSMTAIGEHLGCAVDMCQCMANNITCDCIAMAEGKDAKGGKGKSARKSFRKNNIMALENEMLLKMVRNKAFFGCIHEAFEDACMCEVNMKFVEMAMQLEEMMGESGEEMGEMGEEMAAAEERACGDVPVGRACGTAAEERACGDAPAEERACGDAPAEERACGDAPAEERACGDAPAEERDCTCDSEE